MTSNILFRPLDPSIVGNVISNRYLTVCAIHRYANVVQHLAVLVRYYRCPLVYYTWNYSHICAIS